MQDIQKFEPLWNAWRAVSVLGKGSFGKVYKMAREEHGTTYYSAVKHISVPSDNSQIDNAMANGAKYSDGTIKKYFDNIVSDVLTEINLMYSLKGHTNIVAYEDHLIIPKENGIGADIFIRMELLTGLDSILRERELSYDDKIRLGIDICSALELCEKKDIIHRDIKPANIFLSDTGDFKLGDFGVARVLDGVTKELSQKGTYNYMAPEIYYNKPANTTSDQYSLGIVLYRLFNKNRLPFLAKESFVDTKTEYSALVRRMNGDPLPAPCEADKQLSEVILKACDADPKKRYANATAFKEAITGVITQKKKHSRFIIGLIASVLALLLVIGGAAAAYMLFLKPDPQPVPEEEPPFVFDPDTMYHITLKNPEDVGISSAETMFSLLSKRIEILCGDEPYNIVRADEQVDLMIPKSVFAEETVNAVMDCYIARPARLFVMEKSYPPAFAEEIPREKIKNLELKTGKINGLDVTDLGIDPEAYQYLEISFMDDMQQHLTDLYAEYGDSLRFAQDYDEFQTGFYYFYSYFIDDKFYIIDNDLNGKFSELVYNNLTSPPYEKSYYYILVTEPKWESVSGSDIVGEYQKNAGEITGKNLTIVYKPSYTQDLSEGEKLDFRIQLRKRLDILKQPYAIGNLDEGDAKDHIAVKIPSAVISDEIAQTILDRNPLYYMFTGLIKIDSGFDDPIIDISKDAQGNYSFDISLDKASYSYDDDVSYIAEATKNCTPDDPQTIYFCINSIVFFETEIDHQITDGSVSFNKISFIDQPAVSEEYAFIMDYAKELLLSGSLTASYEYDHVIYNLDENGIPSNNNDTLDTSYTQTDDIINRIKKISPDATVYYDNIGNRVNILLHLPVDDDLPKTSVKVMNEICSDIDFENSILKEIVFYLTDENDELFERTRVFIGKHYASRYSDEKEYIYYWYIFGYLKDDAQGRLTDLKDVFDKTIEKDKNFKQYVKDIG